MGAGPSYNLRTMGEPVSELRSLHTSIVWAIPIHGVTQGLEAWGQSRTASLPFDFDQGVRALDPLEFKGSDPLIRLPFRLTNDACDEIRKRAEALSAGTPRIPHLPAGGGHPARNDRLAEP